MAKRKVKVEPANIELTPKQIMAMDKLRDSTTNTIVYGGSAGGGKSYLGCIWILLMAINYPNTRYLICRTRLTELKKTTLLTFWNVVKDLKRTEQEYTFNASELIFTLKNGSQILFIDVFHASNDNLLQSLQGIECSAIFVDEAGQISREVYRTLLTRIRYNLTENNLIPKILLTCNPSKNFLYEEFYIPFKNNVLSNDKAFIESTIYDNPHIPIDTINVMENMPENSIEKKRYLYGLWEYDIDELCLFDYDAVNEMFIDDIKPINDSAFYLTIDVARFGNDATIIVLWQGYDIINIYPMKGIDIQTQISRINAIKTAYSVENKNIVIDSDGIGGAITDFFKGANNFNNGARSSNGRYQNLKTECYYLLSQNINNRKINIYFKSNDESIKKNIVHELLNVRADKVDLDGKISIESKDKIKKRIGRSPDFADALMMRMVIGIDFSKVQITNEYYFRRIGK